MSNEELAISN